MLDQTDAARKRQINSFRFNWHEQLISDRALHRRPIALALGSYVMHRFKSDIGAAEFSTAGAAQALNIPERSIARAKAFLIVRGWIRLQVAYRPTRMKWSANRYILTGGPDDLILDGKAEDEPGE